MITVDHAVIAVGDSPLSGGCDTAQNCRLRRRVGETARVHRLMRELLTLVPADEAPWPAEARARWMTAFAAVADVVYEDRHLFTGTGHAAPADVAPVATSYVDPASPATYVDAEQHASDRAYPTPPWADPQWVERADALDVTALELGGASVDLRVNRGAEAAAGARHRRRIE
jgi:hypothetical protein